MSGIRGSRTLVYAPLLVLIAALWASWGTPVLDEHGFRQTQTLVSAYWMTRDGAWWLYHTPVLGYPWAVPFEFPLYQWGVAALAMAPLGLDVDAAGRLLSALALVACLWPLRAALKDLGAPERLVDLATVLFVLSPLHLFWGRAAMIESTALLLSMLFVVAVQRLVRGVTAGRFAAALLVAILAALVKITTFFAFALLAGAIVAVALLARCKRREFVAAGRLALATGLPILMALLALKGWLDASDRVKLASPLAEFSASGNLVGWNLRPGLALEVDAFWREKVARRMLPDILGHSLWFFLLAPSLVVRGQWRWLGWLLAAMVLFVAPMLVFTNLHSVHDYYQVANAVFLLVALAVVLHALSEAWPGKAFVLLACVAAAGMLVQFHGDQWRLIRGVSPDHHAPLVAGVLRAHTAPDDVIVTQGLDWSSELPYYAQRRAVMLMRDDFKHFVIPALREPGDGGGLLRLGAVVRCGVQRTDVRELASLMCGPLREMEVAGCSIIVREDPAMPRDADPACEARVLAQARAALAPRPEGALVLGAFSREVLTYRRWHRCNFDFVGEGARHTDQFARHQSLTVLGWMLDEHAARRAPRPMLRVRSESMGRAWYAPLDAIDPRPDLAEAFGPPAGDGGFRATLALHDLPPGRYQLSLVDLSGDEAVTCEPNTRPILIE